MTGDADDELDSIADVLDDETRRSFMKKSAAVSGAVAIGVGATNTAGAQDDGLEEGQKGLIFPTDFHPRARFAFVSPVIEWVPNYPDIRDSAWSNYNTRQIRWQNTGNVVNFWVAQDANVGQYDQNLGFVTDADDDNNQPQLFEMDKEWTPFGDNQNLITVNFSPVDEEEEDDLLDNDAWWQDGGGSTPTETDGGG